MSSIKTTKSHRGVFCINELNRTQVSIPKWVFSYRQDDGKTNTFRHEIPRLRCLKISESVKSQHSTDTFSLQTGRLDRSQHPTDTLSLPLSGQSEMKSSDRGLRGRIFFVIHFDSGSPPGIHGSYHGLLRFENEEQYFFVTNRERISEEKWYEFNYGFRDSAPGYQELLRVIDPEEVSP